MTCTRAARAAGSLTAYWVGWSMERSPVKRMGQRHDSSVPHSLHLLIASMIIVWLQRVHVAFRGALFHWLFWHLVYHRLVAQLTALLSLLRIGAVGEVRERTQIPSPIPLSRHSLPSSSIAAHLRPLGNQSRGQGTRDQPVLGKGILLILRLLLCDGPLHSRDHRLHHQADRASISRASCRPKR